MHTATLVVISAFAASQKVAWVVESLQYVQDLRAALGENNTSWSFRWCGANGSVCNSSVPTKNVSAVVGMADAVDLSALPNLQLVQSVSNYYTTLDAVPDHATVARYNPDYHQYGETVIAEWLIAAALQRLYDLNSRGVAFQSCAFGTDSPFGCEAASTATNHTTFASLTIGVVGYGHIGKAVASMAAGLGATVVATDTIGPFDPPPPPLKWLSPSNDRLFRASDIVFITVAGSAGKIINATSLAMLRNGVHIIPTAHETIDWDDLLRELERRQPDSLFATLVYRPQLVRGWLPMHGSTIMTCLLFCRITGQVGAGIGLMHLVGIRAKPPGRHSRCRNGFHTTLK
jgi:hypothetical protein